MPILSHLEPGKVFSFFEAICAIPHGSGNTAQISEFCVNFAKERGLEHYQDELGNVMILAPGTAGYERSEPVILQGHLDMVCVKTEDCPLDLAHDGLLLEIDGDYIAAKGTSLGGDDGIAVAMILALLDSPELCRPPIEALLTVDEEIGMIGAAAVDFTHLKGKKLINIDSEEEGVFTVSCAGGVRARCMLPVKREAAVLPRCRVTVDGLQGGHSGVEIHKGRGNAITLLNRVLGEAARKSPVRLLSLSGGTADNVIAKSACAVLAVEESDFEVLQDTIRRADAMIAGELAQSDPGVRVRVKRMPAETGMAVVPADMDRILRVVSQLPQGVQKMSQDIPGLVQTSLNIGRAELKEDALELVFSLRSSAVGEKEELLGFLQKLMSESGGSVFTNGDYPAWAYRKDSPLRDLMTEVYAAQYGKEPRISAIHAGLECGLLCSRRSELDCVSMGPDILCAHSVGERLSIPSVARTWELLLKILARSR